MDISVIIPVWNRKQYIKKAIESVVDQTYPAKELIIIDDGSDDGTWELIQTLRYDTITIVRKRIQHCGMPGAVRNRGIEIATHSWLAFLDSDDYWLPHKLEMQVNTISNVQQNNTSLSSHSPLCLFCHTKEIWQRNETIVSQKKQQYARDGNIFQDSLKKCIIGPSTVLMHASIVEQYGMFNETLEIAEDYEYWLRICAHIPVHYVHEPCIVKYSGQQKQLSHKYNYIEKFRIEALMALLQKNTLSDAQKKLAIAELTQKQAIWNRGRSKRQKKQ